MDMDQAIAKAEEIGAEHGKAAASWFEVGTDYNARAILDRGLLDVFDPETVPAPDLSGEWADGYLPRDLFEDATGLDAHLEATWDQDAYQDVLTELCDAYELAFSTAVEAEITRVCQYQLAE